MNFAIKNTFLEFDDGTATAREGAKLRSFSANSTPSSSNSNSSSVPSSSSQLAQRGRHLRENLKVDHGSRPSPGSSGDSLGTPHVITSSRTAHRSEAKHIVWDTSTSSSESPASALVFGVKTQRPTGGLTHVVDGTVESNVAANGNGNLVFGDAASAEIIVSDDGLPSLGAAKHESQTCKPCHYFHSKFGCKLGHACLFCHYSHTKRSTSDIPKPQRNLCQRLVMTIHQGVPGTEEKAYAEEQLLTWMGQDDSRIGAYAFTAIRCFQGECTDKPGVAKFLRAAAEVRKRFTGEEELGDEFHIEDDNEFSTVDSMPCLATEPNEGGGAGSASWFKVSL